MYRDMTDHLKKLARELPYGEREIGAVADLLDGGATLPFIARYRKEATGGLDEVAIAEIRDQLSRLRQLDERRTAIIRSLAKRDLLTSDLNDKLQAAETLVQLEDIYLPFRPKRRTRATVAKERGLEPLARMIFAQDCSDFLDPEEEAASFVDAEKGVASIEEALIGAKDIMAEWISEDVEARTRMRALFQAEGVIRTQATAAKAADANSDAGKFRDYLNLSESIGRVSSHRLLAMLRGAKMGVLSLHIAPAEVEAEAVLEELFIKGDGPASLLVSEAARDGLHRLLAPSIENETLAAARERAEEKAIEVFADNLRQLLLDPPLGQKCVMALDPGFRTGCKLVVLDRLGRLQKSDVVYPHEPHNRTREAAAKVQELCDLYGVEVIAVGNGTAGRETEAFLRNMALPGKISIIMVNESGASVYSTSEVARQEFPDQDATVRGAVSIARRLMDPLAELVKIEPRAIGIGQYQHDVDTSALQRALDDVVSACVNLVGVDVNAASKELLAYVSGLGPRLAEAVVKYRNEHGPFRSRRDLKNVPRLGPKAFEQAAGFLRIRDGDNPLDGTAVHPESYAIVEKMAWDLGVTVRELMQNESLLEKLDPANYVSEKTGASTLADIMEELSRPGRDPRKEYEAFSFAPGVEKIEQLQVGMKLPGIVTNVTAFGAFVDVGVHQDGLVHISQLRDGYVKNPADVVKARERVMVKVMNVDLERKRISLSMKE
jgi:protein Tex